MHVGESDQQYAGSSYAFVTKVWNPRNNSSEIEIRHILAICGRRIGYCSTVRERLHSEYEPPVI